MVHHDVLCKYQLAKDVPTLTTKCGGLEESGDDKENEVEMGDADYLLRTKRNEQKNDINLPPGYSIYRIPKLPDNSPMPVFLFLNISKILDWNEFSEVFTNEISNKNLTSEP